MKTEKIGQRIQDYMEKRQMTIEELSEATGLDVHFLTAVQNDGVYASLGPLLKIARALGVRLGTFLDDQISEDPLVIRESDRTQELNMVRAKDKPVALKFYSLGRGKTDRHMEPFCVDLLPESAKDKKLSSHEGEEFIIVVKGDIEIIYGQEVYHLGVGDSIYYNSIVPHYVSCKGDQTATIHAVLYIPE